MFDNCLIGLGTERTSATLASPVPPRLTPRLQPRLQPRLKPSTQAMIRSTPYSILYSTVLYIRRYCCSCGCTMALGHCTDILSSQLRWSNSQWDDWQCTFLRWVPPVLTDHCMCCSAVCTVHTQPGPYRPCLDQPTLTLTTSTRSFLLAV
jgi:hypothetical protein